MCPTSPALDCDVVLKDGSTLTLRHATSADAPAVLAFLTELSDRSLYQRFFGARKLSLETARSLIPDEPGRGVSVVGQCGDRIVALAGFYKEHADVPQAEVAFAIADTMQGKGVGTRLLERLAETARRQDIQRFDAYVLGDNTRMLEVFRDSGFTVQQTLESGVFHVTLSLDRTAMFLERSARRAQTAATASLQPFFEPQSVAHDRLEPGAGEDWVGDSPQPDGVRLPWAHTPCPSIRVHDRGLDLLPDRSGDPWPRRPGSHCRPGQ